MDTVIGATFLASVLLKWNKKSMGNNVLAILLLYWYWYGPYLYQKVLILVLVMILVLVILFELKVFNTFQQYFYKN